MPDREESRQRRPWEIALTEKGQPKVQLSILSSESPKKYSRTYKGQTPTTIKYVIPESRSPPQSNLFAY